MNPLPQSLSWTELKARFATRLQGGSDWFNTPPHLVWAETGSADDPCAGFRALVYPGNTELPELTYRNSSGFEPGDCNCIVIEGDLHLSGDLDLRMSDVGLPGYLHVLGNLTAQNLFIREQCELVVEGSLTLDNALIASRWANGQLNIGQDLSCRHAYLNDFYLKVAGNIERPLYLQDADKVTTPAANAARLLPLADWYVLDFPDIDEVDDEDPLFQQHLIFNDCMFEDVPYHQSEDDKLWYWIVRGVEVFRTLNPG
ncbi:MAG: hypothetical protein ABWY06_25130 [Pseudomonas sp.]|uniref:hypothetical protein n=1 Tax=Pseudomonas sp. TaxID=306 RepID=UPI003398CB9D